MKNNENLTFGEAIEALKQGKKVARKGWNGKNMYLFLITRNILGKCGCQFEFKRYFQDIIQYVDKDDFMDSGHIKIDDVIAMRTAQKTVQLGWLASQADILAEDWMVVN